MLENIIFKPNVGLVSSITGRILHPKAFGITGYGVFDYKTGQLLITEQELINRAQSYLPIDDDTTFNKLKKLFDFSIGGDTQTTYRRPKITVTKIESNVDSDRGFEENSSIGMLIQPYTYIQWGGIDLDPKWFRDVSWDWGEDETPGGLSLRLDPMAPFGDLPMGNNGEGSEIYVEFGYTDKRKLSGTFIHTGTTIQSGNDMSVEIEGSHKSFTADQTPQRNRYFTTPNSKIKYLRHIQDVFKPYNIKFEVSNNKIELLEFKTSSQAETDMAYLQRNNQNFGLTTSYSWSKKADILIQPMGLSKRKNPKPAKDSGETNHIEPYAFYLGPGLITTITRRVIARKVSSPPATDKTPSESNAVVDVKEAPAKDPIKTFVKNVAGASDSLGALKDTTVANTNSLKDKKGGDPTGPAAKANEPLSPNESKDVEEKDTELKKEINENKEEKLEQGQVEMDADFLMVPRVVGIKPSDIVVIMWMEEGDYKYQDFLVKTVSYTQEGAMYRVSISASRWLKSKPMVENWDEIKADMEARGLLSGEGVDHGHKLYSDTDDYYPRYNRWVEYYWGS